MFGPAPPVTKRVETDQSCCFLSPVAQIMIRRKQITTSQSFRDAITFDLITMGCPCPRGFGRNRYVQAWGMHVHVDSSILAAVNIPTCHWLVSLGWCGAVWCGVTKQGGVTILVESSRE
jgi:hypothetical protein